MRKIYGILGAPALASSAAICFCLLEELGLDYERVNIDFSKGEHKSPEYLKLNPNGKIPTLVEDGFVLWESGAINDYLAKKYKPELLGNTIEEQALVSQWNHWAAVEYKMPIVQVFVNNRLPEEKRNPNTLENTKKRLKELNAILENALEGKDYLVGNTFTLADLHTSFALAILGRIGIDISEFKNVSRYLGAFTQRPAFQKLSKM